MTTPDELADYAREDLDVLPAYHGCNAVSVRRGGRKLAAEYWRGAQWSATAFGVERRDGGFRIPMSRIWEHEQSCPWPVYMATIDEEIDLQDFCEALRISRAVNAGRLNPRSLRPSFAAVG